jgi:hypothetical protein
MLIWLAPQQWRIAFHLAFLLSHAQPMKCRSFFRLLNVNDVSGIMQLALDIQQAATDS